MAKVKLSIVSIARLVSSVLATCVKRMRTQEDPLFDRMPNRQTTLYCERPNVMVISWVRQGVGIGQITLHAHKDGLSLDSDSMGAEFVKEVIGALVDDAYAAGRGS